VRQRLACVGAILGLGLGAGTVHGASGHLVAARTPSLAACSKSYVTAHLSWGEKCLRAGEFCKIANTEYRRYGFVCPATGHLRRL
jgi:hypothetical protein